MITLWLQAAVGGFMSNTVSSAAIKVATKFVPAEHMATAQQIVEKLFDPNAALIVMGTVVEGAASEVRR